MDIYRLLALAPSPFWRPGSRTQVLLRLLVSLTSCLLVFSLGCSNKPSDEPVFVGHLAPDDPPARQAILLAVEEANAAETKVAGRPVAVLHPPVKNDADVERAAVRLITIDRVAALLGGAGPAATEQLSRTAQQYQVPFVATVSPVSGTLPPNGFSIGLSPSARGKAAARFLAEDLQKPAIVLVTDARVPVNAAVAAAFTAAYRGAGGAVERQRDYADDKQRADLLADLTRDKTGAVVWVGSAADFARLLAAKRESDGPLLYAGEETAPAVLVPNDRSATYRVTAFAVDPKLPATKEFAEKFQGRFQHPPGASAALAYDSARVLFDAMRRAGSFAGAKVRDALLATKDFASVTGPLSFDKVQNTRRPAFVVRLEKGGEKFVKRYDPE